VEPLRDGAGVLSPDQVGRLLEEKEARDRRAEPAQLGCLTVVVVALVLGCLNIPLSMLAEWLDAGDLHARHGATALLTVAAVVVSAMLIAWAISRRIERNLGLTIRLAERIVRPGDDLVCTIGLRAARPRRIAGAEVDVIAEESSTSTSPGEAGSTRRTTLFHRTVVASPPRTLDAGRPGRFTVRVALPRDAAASFESRHHGVEWRARVSLRLGRRTSIDRTLAFVVHPNGSP
jgi:hypothetical protein